MGSRARVAIRDQEIDTHPAVQAWCQLGVWRHPIATVEVWREKPTQQPASIYRIVFRNSAIPAVFAKHCPPREGTVERLCLEAILPRIRVTSPEYYGSIEDADGSRWLFLEDVGQERLSREDPQHRLLAARWLGRLHRQAAHVPAANTLPPAGPHRYWNHLRSAHERIHRNLGHPGLSPADRDVLKAVLVLQGQVAARWDQIERACAELPSTLVHGDFQPKNVRIRSGSAGPAVYVLDWEMAGWGNPAVDLVPMGRVQLPIEAEVAAYASEVGEEWPRLDAAAVRRMSVLGSILRRLAGMDWETASLHLEQPDSLSGPVSSLESMHRSLSSGLEAAEAWLA